MPISNQSQLLLHLPDVARCFCNFCPLQVPFCQELLNVLLLLLQGLLEGRGARNFSCIAGRGFCQLHKRNELKIILHQEKGNRAVVVPQIHKHRVSRANAFCDLLHLLLICTLKFIFQNLTVASTQLCNEEQPEEEAGGMKWK